MTEEKETTNCLKCGKEIEKIASEVPLSKYCKECFREIKKKINQGAITVEKRESSSWNGFRIYKRGEEYRRSEDLTKSEAILIGKKIADDLGVEALYKDDQKNTMWVMDNYLDNHPEVKSKVQDLEGKSGGILGSVAENIRNIFSQ